MELCARADRAEFLAKGQLRSAGHVLNRGSVLVASNRAAGSALGGDVQSAGAWAVSGSLELRGRAAFSGALRVDAGAELLVAGWSCCAADVVAACRCCYVS